MNHVSAALVAALTAALRDNKNPASLAEKAVIHNLIHDCRISPARGETLESIIKHRTERYKESTIIFEVIAALKEYKERYVLRRHTLSDKSHLPLGYFAFLDERDNVANILDRRQHESERKDVKYLGRVFNLSAFVLTERLKRMRDVVSSFDLPSHPSVKNTLHRSLQHGTEQSGLELTRKLKVRIKAAKQSTKRRLEEAIDLLELQEWSPEQFPFSIYLTELIKKQNNHESVKSFARAVIKLLNFHRRVETFEPTWAFCWNEVEKLIFDGVWPQVERFSDLEAHEWCESVGVTAKQDDWIVLIKYRASRVRKLIRPTLLEASDHPYHFPSPHVDPSAISKSGHPMWLYQNTPNSAGIRLLSEYVHKTISHPLDEIVSVKQMKMTVPVDQSLLSTWRAAHHAALATRYTTGVYDWMKNPNAL